MIYNIYNPFRNNQRDLCWCDSYMSSISVSFDIVLNKTLQNNTQELVKFIIKNQIKSSFMQDIKNLLVNFKRKFYYLNYMQRNKQQTIKSKMI